DRGRVTGTGGHGRRGGRPDPGSDRGGDLRVRRHRSRVHPTPLHVLPAADLGMDDAGMDAPSRVRLRVARRPCRRESSPSPRVHRAVTMSRPDVRFRPVDHWEAIASERRALADQLEGLSPAQWGTQSLCEAWTVRDVAAHLVLPHKTSIPSFLVALVAA